MRVEVIGVYPIKAPEPCHLIELRFVDVEQPISFAGITQENRNQPRSSWQVAYDERWLDSEGQREIGSPDGTNARTAFFFHYLDFHKPLQTSAGSLELPLPSKVPDRLKFIEYLPPC